MRFKMTLTPAPVFFFLNMLSFFCFFKGKVGSKSLVVLDMFASHMGTLISTQVLTTFFVCPVRGLC